MIKIILNAVGILIGGVLGSCINYSKDKKEELEHMEVLEYIRKKGIDERRRI